MNLDPTYLTGFAGVAIPLGMPATLALVIWFASFRSMGDWWAGMILVLAGCWFLVVVARWDIVGYQWRFVVPGISVMVAAVSYFRHSNVYRRGTTRTWRDALRLLFTLSTAGAMLLAGIRAISANDGEPEVALSYPLRNGTFYVGQGGGTFLTNMHRTVASQRHAVDIVRLNERGRRATSIYPDELEGYAIFGDTVYSPIAGKVVWVEASLPDNAPPARNRSMPAGNHIVLREQDHFVLLAHLKNNSIRVVAGDEIRIGQPVALVGNSGNSTEPHLHIHAVEGEPPDSEKITKWIIGSARPVPMLFGGARLRRNDVFH